MAAEPQASPEDDEPRSLRRLEDRAVRERWPMSEAVRVKILNRLCKVVDDDAWDEHDPHRPNTREVIAASQTLIAADGHNLAQQRIDLARARHDRAQGGGGMAEVHERMAAYLDPDAPTTTDPA